MSHRKPAAAKLPVLAQLLQADPHPPQRQPRQKARYRKTGSHLLGVELRRHPALRADHPRDEPQRRSAMPSVTNCHWLSSLRGATAPPRNTLSHANKTRDSNMMEELYWKTPHHLENTEPGGFGLRYKGCPAVSKRPSVHRLLHHLAPRKLHVLGKTPPPQSRRQAPPVPQPSVPISKTAKSRCSTRLTSTFPPSAPCTATEFNGSPEPRLTWPASPGKAPSQAHR
jgi:hypothetical protein